MYIEEKRRIEKELEEETAQRLAKIKEKLSKVDTSHSTEQKPIEPSQPQPESQSVTDTEKRSLKSLIYYYISFGYWNKKN